MIVAILLLSLFGILHLILGIVWNNNRFKYAKKYSPKYRALFIFGIIEIAASLSCFIFNFFWRSHLEKLFHLIVWHELSLECSTKKCSFAFEYFIQSGKDFLVIGGGGGIHQPLGIERTDLQPDYKPQFHFLTITTGSGHLKIESQSLKEDFSGFDKRDIIDLKWLHTISTSSQSLRLTSCPQ